MQNTQLTLLLPEINVDELKSLTSKLPALKLMLNRADIEELSANSWEELLCQAFGIEHTTELPIAALTGLADGLATQTGYWLRADPVQLQADLSAVYLVGNHTFDLTEQELISFKQELSAFLQQDQLQLFTPTAKRWYLQSNQVIPLMTSSLNSVIGKNIMGFLPTGAGQDYWRKLFTEIQMLLYTSPTNQQRANQELATVNGTWFWGAGQLPTATKTPWQIIWADDNLLKGLAQVTNTSIKSVPSHAQIVLAQIANSQHGLLSLTPGNQLSMEDWLQQIEINWLKPCITALRKKQLNSMIIYLGNKKLFHLNWKTIRYFWRRRT